jgi:hypothetical protein
LNGEELLIWTHRTGYQAEQLTLQELGDKLNVTRERIRQRAEKLNQLLCRGIRVNPEIFLEKLTQIKQSDVFGELTIFRNMFCNDAAMMRMMALISGTDYRTLTERFNPPVQNDILHKFLCLHPYPASRIKVLEALQQELEVDDDEAEVYLAGLIKKDFFQTKGGNLIPRKLPKEVAVCHVLAGYEQGLGWREIVSMVNSLGICRTELSSERSDQVLNSSSCIYQSDARIFSHIRFLNVNREDVFNILEDIKFELKKSPHKSIHLMTEYYSKLEGTKYDYYTVRHVARDFGQSQGVYFYGKSQADTVSLFPDSKILSQKEAVSRLFFSAKTPLSVEQIASHIRSQTEGHARFYIDKLLREGEIVSTEPDQYLSREKAFASINRGGVSKSILALITEDSRIHHISSLSRHLNRISHSSHSIRYWTAFLNAYADDYGWYAKRSLVSMWPVRVTGLIELVRQAPDVQGEDLIAWVQQRVCATRDAIKRAIHNSGVLETQPDEGDSSVGLASDIMQELFEL